MRWKRLFGGFAAASIMAAACGGSSGTTGGSTSPTPTVRSVSVAGNSSVVAGLTTQMTATATFSDNTTQNVTSSSNWTSSSSAIATVSSTGLVTGLTTGSSNITAAFQNVTSPGFSMQVTPTPVRAAFTVTPNTGLVGNPGQCPVTPAPPVNQLLCKFDATSSTPSGAITSYDWEIPDSGKHFSGATLQSITVPCGSIGGGGTKKVKLSIVAPGGTDTISADVTFIKSTPC